MLGGAPIMVCLRRFIVAEMSKVFEVLLEEFRRPLSLYRRKATIAGSVATDAIEDPAGAGGEKGLDPTMDRFRSGE